MEMDLAPADRLKLHQTRAASLDMDALLYNMHDIAVTLYARSSAYNGFDLRDPYNARLSIEAGVYSAELQRRFDRSAKR